ncbi:casparian strip membrane protein 3-like [Solanum dulcamara]|uniref:casparian strip membrane protein 3-like n=1 Tax=Solanum dulcamara TaxID=45834 RepID=UPI002486555F|nr:casparian strip membrane protein 3-like [Solanum dulcamara]
MGASEAGDDSKDSKPNGNRGISFLDFLMRIVAILGTLGSAIAMGLTSNENLPSFEQFIRFKAEYKDLPTFTFFVVANGIVSAYLAVSLVLSILHIVMSGARITRVVLIFFDTVMMAFLTSGASAAAAIVYLAHKGNARANWIAICQHYNSFCDRASGSLVGSFIGVLVFLLLIILSALALSRN